MSGANGIGKKAVWNRENQFATLQSAGIRWSEANMNLGTNGIPRATITSTPLTAAQLLADWVLDVSSPNVLAAPNHNLLNTLFEQQSHYFVGNSFTVEVTNFDGVQKTLAFGTGYQVNPNPLVIPPLSKGYVTIELIGIPCQFQVTAINWGVINNTNVVPALPPALSLPPGNNPGDLLEWNGVTWLPTDPTLNNLTPALLNRISPFPTPSLAPFQRISLESAITVNGTTPGGIFRPMNGQILDSVVSVAVDTYNFAGQAGVQVITDANYDAQDINLSFDANFFSDFRGTTSNLAPLGSPNHLWHFLGLTNFMPFGMDIGGQMFATSFTVMSDRRLKKNISPVSLDSKTLRKLNPVRFQMKEQADDSPSTLGFLAQEVEELIPEAVSTMGNEAKTKNLCTIPLLTALLAYTKDLEKRVSELEKKDQERTENARLIKLK